MIPAGQLRHPGGAFFLMGHVCSNGGALKANVYFDSQNLYMAVRGLWGHTYNKYDPILLATAICERRGFTLGDVYYYFGMPDQQKQPRLNAFWRLKHAAMKGAGVKSLPAPIRYADQEIYCPKCDKQTLSCSDCGPIRRANVGREKMTDTRIALDMVNHFQDAECEALVLFSQDSDFEPAAIAIKNWSLRTGRPVQLVCAFPPTGDTRGITHFKPEMFDKATFDACLDPNNYGLQPRNP